MITQSDKDVVSAEVHEIAAAVHAKPRSVMAVAAWIAGEVTTDPRLGHALNGLLAAGAGELFAGTMPNQAETMAMLDRAADETNRRSHGHASKIEQLIEQLVLSAKRADATPSEASETPRQSSQEPEGEHQA